MARYRRKKRKVHPVIWFVCSVVILIGLTSWFYTTIQQPLWQEREAARQLILQQSKLDQINEILPFIEEDKYYIATGTDQEGRSMVVWVKEDEVYEAYTADNYSATLVRQQLLEEEPAANIIRLVPGVYQNEYAWEVYYEKEEEDGSRRYYTYYRFRDGEKLDTYRLPLQH